MPSLHLLVGNVYLKIKKWDKALKSFERTIDIDVNNAAAYLGLAICNLRLYDFEKSAEMALASISLNHLNPDSHYYLGEALYNLNDFENAANAFEVVISINPGYKKAHEWLIKIYDLHLNQPEKANKSKQFIKDKIIGTITIVSGLPRSGTSMMMQMLLAGGADILTDNLREKDQNNPNGYLEYEKVKGMANDVSWLNEAVGKVVKIISHQLKFLPNNFNYKIIFMKRELAEVLKSQQIMLGKNPEVFPTKLAETFQIQQDRVLSVIHGEPNMEILVVDYANAIANPEEEAENVNAFLGGDLDIIKMTEAIDKNLYRNKTFRV